MDFAGEPILKSGLSSFLITLWNESTETIINSIQQQDRLAEVATDGSFILKLDDEDNVIVDTANLATGQIEKHFLALYWSWNDGSQDRSGIQLIRFRLQRLAVAVGP